MKKTVLFVATMLAAAGSAQVAQAALETITWDGSTPPGDLSNVVITTNADEVIEKAGEDNFVNFVTVNGTGSVENVSLNITATNKTASAGKQLDALRTNAGSNVTWGGQTFGISLDTNFTGGGNDHEIGLALYGGTHTISADVANISVTSRSTEGKAVYGVVVSGGPVVNLTGRELTIRVESATVRTPADQYSEAIAVDLAKGTLTSSEGTTVRITGSTSGEAATTASTSGKANTYTGTTPLTGIKFEGGQANFQGDVFIDMSSVGGLVEGVKVTNHFYNSTEGNVWGSSAAHFNNLTITSSSQTGDAYGVASNYVKDDQQPLTDVLLGVSGTARITASSTSGNAYGLHLNGPADISFSGNLTVTATAGQGKAAYALYSEGTSLILNGPSVTLNGDVSVSGATLQFGGTTAVTNRLLRAAVSPLADGTPTNVTINGDTSVTGTNSEINLLNAVATFNGDVKTDSSADVTLQNSDVTVVDGTLTASTVTSSGGSSLYLSGGSKATISTLNSTGETVVKFDSTDNKATINSVTGTGGSITAEGSSVFNEQYGSAAEAAEAAASVVINSTGQTVAEKVVIDESESNGGYEAELDGNGHIDESTVVETLNTKTKRVGQTLSQNILAWRLEMNDLNKRLGELRDSEGNTGLWARVNAGTQRYKGSDNDFVMLQVGADTKVPAIWNTHVGAAFSYTKADLSYTGGDGDNEIYGLAGYASWLGDSGSFLDVIAKVAYLDSDSKIDGTQAKFDTMAYSLSAEIGHRFDVTNIVFVEPQMELSYGYVKGKTFDTKSATGIRTKTTIDGTDSLIGRVGFRAGLTSPEKKGNVYVRASVLREFQGDFTMTRGDGTYSVETKDTWFEYGVGGNYNISPTTQIYADVERNTGADLSEPWRFNIGARWSF